jgi:hypothetical protein
VDLLGPTRGAPPPSGTIDARPRSRPISRRSRAELQGIAPSSKPASPSLGGAPRGSSDPRARLHRLRDGRESRALSACAAIGAAGGFAGPYPRCPRRSRRRLLVCGEPLRVARRRSAAPRTARHLHRPSLCARRPSRSRQSLPTRPIPTHRDARNRRRVRRPAARRHRANPFRRGGSSRLAPAARKRRNADGADHAHGRESPSLVQPAEARPRLRSDPPGVGGGAALGEGGLQSHVPAPGHRRRPPPRRHPTNRPLPTHLHGPFPRRGPLPEHWPPPSSRGKRNPLQHPSGRAGLGSRPCVARQPPPPGAR